MNVLITGMSGTGKSSVIIALRDAGHRAIDLDEGGWSGWIPSDGNPTGAKPGHDWLWDETRLKALLAEDHDTPLFVAGCAPNMGQFIQDFEVIVLLSAPLSTLLKRLRRRSGNTYGKAPREVAQIEMNHREIEPRLRRIATHEFDASRALPNVVSNIEAVLG